MTTVRLRADGGVSVDVAWERYVKPGHWTDWAPQLRRVETSAEEIRPALTGRVVGPLGISARFTVDTVDSTAHRWSWTVRLWTATVHLEHGVDPRAGGCSAWVTIQGPMPLVRAYVPAARLALRRLVAD